MKPAPDAYKVLQVDSEADPEVIQAAYRRLAQKFHPDHADGLETPKGREAAQRMVAINAAWEILGDETRRAAYDRDRTASGAGSHGAAASSQRPTAGTASSVALHPDDRIRAADRITFGRYAGWRLEEILRADPGYLEWLDRTPAGRPYRVEIDALLRRSGRRARGTGSTGGLPRRR